MAFNWVKFPWTNLHDLNLDWIIQTVKTLENNLADAVGKFTEIVNTAVGAEREERIAKDAEIQAEITTEVYPAISKSITDTITGSGDLNIDKTGAVNITGNGVKIEDKRTGGHAQIIGGAFISGAGEQISLHNPNSSTSMTANYNSGVLKLSNSQEPAKGVAVYPINTPADGGGDNSSFAANVGYVKTAVEAVSNALTTETENRTSGDAALQSTIDNVIMPLLNAQKVHDFHVAGTVIVGGALTTVTFKDGYPKSDFDNLISQGKRVRLVVDIDNETRYFEQCYTNGGDVAFSGVYIDDNEVTAAQAISYSGTNFVPLAALHML